MSDISFMPDVKDCTRAIKQHIERWSLWPLKFSDVDNIYIRVLNDQIVQWFSYQGENFNANPFLNTVPQAGVFPLCSSPDIVWSNKAFINMVSAPFNTSDVLQTQLKNLEIFIFEQIRRPLYMNINSIQQYYAYIYEHQLYYLLERLSLPRDYKDFTQDEINKRKSKNMTFFSINGVKNVAEPNYRGDWSKYDFPYTKVTFPVFRELTEDERHEIKNLQHPDDANWRTHFGAKLASILAAIIIKDMQISKTKINPTDHYPIVYQWLVYTMCDKKGHLLASNTDINKQKKYKDNCDIIASFLTSDFTPGMPQKLKKLWEYQYYLQSMGYDFSDTENFMRLLYSIINHFGLYRTQIG